MNSIAANSVVWYNIIIIFKEQQYGILQRQPTPFCRPQAFHGWIRMQMQKCGLVVKFNRGWPERIEQKEMDEFLQKYKGSKIDF